MESTSLPEAARSGKIAILAIVIVALVLTIFAWWFRFQQGDQAIAFWGPVAAQRIRHAPRVELLEFTPLSPASGEDGASRGETESLQADGATLWIGRRQDVSQALGLVHARHSLIVDQNFQWGARAKQAPGLAPGSWDLGWRFADDRGEALVLIDFDSGQVKLAGGKESAILAERIVVGMRDYSRRQFASEPERGRE